MFEFAWDAWKAEHNLRVHGVSFEFAVRVFEDPDVQFRRDYFGTELRDHAIGLAGSAILLLVVHTVIDEDEDTTRIRIISARLAERGERRLYRDAQTSGRYSVD